MTIWFHRYRRMKLKMAAMTALNEELHKANLELQEKLTKAFWDAEAEAAIASKHWNNLHQEKLAALALNQAMCEANIELTERIEHLETRIKDLEKAQDALLAERDELTSQLHFRDFS